MMDRAVPIKRDLIFLTGFMASGKSTIGPILANTLGYDYIDLDAEITRRTGRRVSEIFEVEGEPTFRKIEGSILEEASAHHRYVVSLGGGTLTYPGNLFLIKKTGLLIYLKVDPEQIFRRLRYKADRPLIKSEGGTSLSDDELRARIAAILAHREPMYREADYTFRTDEHRVGITVDTIAKMILPVIIP